MNLRTHDHSVTKSFLADLERDGTKALAGSTFPGYGHRSAGFGGLSLGLYQPGAGYDYAAEAGDVKRNATIAVGLAWLGNNWAEAKPRVMRRNADGDSEPVPTHPLVKLIHRPNPHQSWATLSKAVLADYKAWGSGFLMVAAGPLYEPGDPIELWWLPRQQMRPVVEGEDFLTGWEYSVGSRKIRLRLDQVIHFQDGIDPANPHFGLSALQACLREVCTVNEAASYTASLLRNFGVAGYMVTPKNPEAQFGDRTKREEVADDIQERTTGEKRGKPLVFNSALQVDQLGYSPEQLALDKILGIPECRLAAALGLSTMVLNLASGSTQKTYANYGESRRAAYEDGLCPGWRDWGYTIDRVLLPLMGDSDTEYFEFNYSEIAALRDSEDAKYTRAITAFEKNLVLKNEGRKMVGLGPVELGDVFANGSRPEPESAGDSEPTAGPTAANGSVVQDLALNGAQIGSLATLVTQVVAGQLPLESARGMILVAFPSITPDDVAAILEPTRTFKPATPEPAAKPTPSPVAAAEPEEEEDNEERAVKALMPRMERLLDQLGVTA